MDGCGEGLGIKLPQYPCAFLSGHPMRHCPIVAMAAPGRARRDRWRFSFRHKERTPFAITSSAWASPPKKTTDKGLREVRFCARSGGYTLLRHFSQLGAG